MTLLLNWRVWVALALAGLLAFSHLTAYRKGRHDVQESWDSAIATANEEARKLEQERQRRADDAARIAAAAQSRILASAAAARRESDGLRDDLNAANEYAKKSRASAERTARVSTAMVEECGRALVEVSEAADRADSYARQLMGAWPK